MCITSITSCITVVTIASTIIIIIIIIVRSSAEVISHVCFSLRLFLVLRPCMFMGLTRSGSYFQAVKSPNTQATPQEVRPKGS